MPDTSSEGKLDFEERKLWIEYIARLIDRRKRSARESGLTTWAMAVAAAYIFITNYWYIASLATGKYLDPVIAFPFAIHYNIIIAIILTCSFVGGVKSITTDRARFTPKAFQNNKRIAILLLFTPLLIVIPTNLIVAHDNNIAISKYPFYSLAAIYTLLTISAIYDYFANKTDLRKTKIPHFEPGLNLGEEMAKKYTLVLAIIVLLFWAINLISIFSIISANIQKEYFEHFKTSLEIICMMSIVLTLSYRTIFHKATYPLYELEQRILLEKLNAEDIAVEYSKLYLGTTVSTWMNENEKLLQEFHDEYIEVSRKIPSEIEKISQLDKSLKFEISGRFDKLIEDLNNSFDKFDTQMTMILTAYEYFSKSAASETVPIKSRLGKLKEINTSVKEVNTEVHSKCRFFTEKVINAKSE